MTNDPLTLRLRRHLAETADYRAAPSQLEALARVSAAASQQRPWFVRLRWLFDPSAPSTNASLRYGAIVLALLLVATALVLLAGAGQERLAPRSFVGSWVSVDPVDDSLQTLVIGVGESPAVHFEDAFSINCERRDESTLYVADGQGSIDSNRLSLNLVGGCETSLDWPVSYVYDPATDTLFDQDRITWTRAP